MWRGPLSNKALGALFKTAKRSSRSLGQRITDFIPHMVWMETGTGVETVFPETLSLRVLQDFLSAVGVGLSALGGHLRFWEILPCICALLCIPSHFSAHTHTQKNLPKLPLTDVLIRLHLNSHSFSSGLLLLSNSLCTEVNYLEFWGGQSCSSNSMLNLQYSHTSL